MKKKILYQKRLDQQRADTAEHNRRVRGYSTKEEKEAEAKMEPWRRLENPDKKGLGGKTYLHSGVTTRNRSRSAKERIKRLNEADPRMTNFAPIKGHITDAGRKSRKDLKAMLAREKKAKEMGLTEYEMLKGKGTKKRRKKSIKGILEEQGY